MATNGESTSELPSLPTASEVLARIDLSGNPYDGFPARGRPLESEPQGSSVQYHQRLEDVYEDINPTRAALHQKTADMYPDLLKVASETGQKFALMTSLGPLYFKKEEESRAMKDRLTEEGTIERDGALVVTISETVEPPQGTDSPGVEEVMPPYDGFEKDLLRLFQLDVAGGGTEREDDALDPLTRSFATKIKDKIADSSNQ